MTKERATKMSRYVASFVLAFTMLFAGTTAIRLPAQEKPVKLSHQQLNDLTKNAKEPADHEKLATYYRQEAARMRYESKGHQDLARIYGTTKPAALTGAPHCDTLAKLDADAAKEFDALAAMHADMAKATAH
jgi:hypothetical protein